MKLISLPLLLIELAVITLYGCRSDTPDCDLIDKSIPLLNFHYVTFYPHDTTSFTEGLLIYMDVLFESTGSPSGSRFRSVFGPLDLKTGKINIKAELDKEKYFGEGIAYLNGKFYQLNLYNSIGFIYDAITYEKLGEYSFPCSEGWGLTTDGKYLIMSDGTDKLTYLDPQTFGVVKIISVTEGGKPKAQLNELEYIESYIYANIWLTNTIVKINPSNGKVSGVIDLTSLANDAKKVYSGSMEMNGVAFNPRSNTILFTGKLWPKIYEIALTK